MDRGDFYRRPGGGHAKRPSSAATTSSSRPASSTAPGSASRTSCCGWRTRAAPLGWSVRGRGHQAGAHGQGRRAAPDLRLQRDARGHPGRVPGHDVRGAGRQGQGDAGLPHGRLPGLLPSGASALPGARRRSGTGLPSPVARRTRSRSSTAGSARWDELCSKRRRDDDHLSLVAGITAKTRASLVEREVDTRRGLARAGSCPWHRRSRARARRCWRGSSGRRSSRSRARTSGATSTSCWSHTRTDDGTLDTTKGLLALPQPSPGDLYLDLEGDPFIGDDGMDYLFGLLQPEETGADGQAAVPRLLEQGRRRRGHRGWREGRVRGLHRQDHGAPGRGPGPPRLPLRAVRAQPPRHGSWAATTRARMRSTGSSAATSSSTSTGSCGRACGPRSRATRSRSWSRSTASAARSSCALPDDSIVEFERWLELGGHGRRRRRGDPRQKIEDYNRDDVVSTLSCTAGWKAPRRAGGQTGRGPASAGGRRTAGPSDDLAEYLQRIQDVAEPLTAGIPDESRAGDLDGATSVHVSCWPSCSAGTGASRSPTGGATSASSSCPGTR